MKHIRRFWYYKTSMSEYKLYLVVGGLGNDAQYMSKFIKILQQSSTRRVIFIEFDVHISSQSLQLLVQNVIAKNDCRTVLIAFSAACKPMFDLSCKGIADKWFIDPCNVFPDTSAISCVHSQIPSMQSLKLHRFSKKREMARQRMWRLIFSESQNVLWNVLQMLKTFLRLFNTISRVDYNLLCHDKSVVKRFIEQNVLNQCPMWVMKSKHRVNIIYGNKSIYKQYAELASDYNPLVRVHKVYDATHHVLYEHPDHVATIILNSPTRSCNFLP